MNFGFDFSQPMTYAFLMLALSFLGAIIRLIRGPSLPDRVVALDFMAMLSIGMITLHAVTTEYKTYLDIAIVLGLLSFLSTVAFARFVEQQEKQRKQKKTRKQA